MSTQKEAGQKTRKASPYLISVLILIALIAGLSLLALSPAFCDWYTDHIYGYLCDGISHVTALFPFAVGEIIMFLGAALLLAVPILMILLIFLFKKTGYRRFCAGYFKFLSIAFLSIVLIYLPCWFIPYNGTVLGMGNPGLRTEYTYDELHDLIWYIVDGGNAAAEEIAIAEDGSVSFPSEEEYRAAINKAMDDLKDEFPRLAGFYPPVKVAICSDILDRMWIGGYNYPYTMEPTHNRYISPLYRPVLDAHELSHHHGYYKENEANFLSQLALSRSENPYLRLSAFMDMYSYVYFDYLDAQDRVLQQMIDAGEVVWPEEIKTKEQVMEAKQILEDIFGEDPEFSERVSLISNAGQEIEEELYNEDPHPLDDLPEADELIHETADQGWQIQGDILQDNTYDGVVLLLLQYYYEYGHSFR